MKYPFPWPELDNYEPYIVYVNDDIFVFPNFKSVSKFQDELLKFNIPHHFKYPRYQELCDKLNAK